METYSSSNNAAAQDAKEVLTLLKQTKIKIVQKTKYFFNARKMTVKEKRAKATTDGPRMT